MWQDRTPISEPRANGHHRVATVGSSHEPHTSVVLIRIRLMMVMLNRIQNSVIFRLRLLVNTLMFLKRKGEWSSHYSSPAPGKINQFQIHISWTISTAPFTEKITSVYLTLTYSIQNQYKNSNSNTSPTQCYSRPFIHTKPIKIYSNWSFQQEKEWKKLLTTAALQTSPKPQIQFLSR